MSESAVQKFETDALADLILAKRECLSRLRDIGRKQLDLIERSEMTLLMDLLAAKQKPLNQLQRIERALEPFRNQDPETRLWRSPNARAQCAEHLRQCEAILAEVITHEKYCESVMIRRRDDTASQLEGAHLAGHARRAYVGEPRDVRHELDLSSDA